MFLYQVLNQVLENKVYYALSIKESIELPIVVYQELKNKSKLFADDSYIFRESTIQITLITKDKNLRLEKALEDKLKENDINYQLVNEFYLNKSGLYRIYEIKMEEINYEQ